MIEVGTKDKIFAAVILPLLAIGCFIYFVRSSEVKKRDEMRRRLVALPEQTGFAITERRLKEEIDIAETELKKVKSQKPLEVKVIADKNESIALRREAVLKIFRANGANVTAILPLEETGEAAAALKKTGFRTSPEAVKISFEADYPSVTASLKEIEEKKMAVITDTVEMSSRDKCRWELVLWF